MTTTTTTWRFWLLKLSYIKLFLCSTVFSGMEAKFTGLKRYALKNTVRILTKAGASVVAYCHVIDVLCVGNQRRTKHVTTVRNEGIDIISAVRL